jgi:site-specific DNA-methyltransferase (adenine-specific)/adenine-specific DNA-methyltransferase
MPTLNWIGKEAVEKHHLEIPYRLLEYDDELSTGDKETGNLLIQGDNLHALKALLPYYAGKVKCIYIDPPYNTGNENWCYNDNVNAPEIKKWLNEVVGKEGEDLTRHDKWLCMMYPRLQMLKRLLSKEGVIFVSIDDNELHLLRSLMDEIFGVYNFIAKIIWQKRKGGGNDSFFLATDHEYIIVYAKRKNVFKNKWRVPYDEKYLKRYKEIDDVGRYYWDTLSRAGLNNPIIYDVVCPDGTIIKNGTWQISKAQFEIKQKEGNIKIEKNKVSGWTVFHKVRMPAGKVFRSIYSEQTNKDAADQMFELFGDKKHFSTPKPLNLIKSVISLAGNSQSLILDSFSGSGTTGQAVLDLNKEDGGNRKFILIELEEDIAKNVTAERLKRVITGYEIKKQNGTTEKVEGLGGGFRYCKLGEPLFDQYGNVREGVTFKQLAYHIFFSETGAPLKENAKLDTPLIGKYKGVAYYLLFNGILGDKTVNGGNVLTSKVLGSLPKYKGDKIIFGMANRLSTARLKKENIVFRQIPVEIKIS